MKIKKEFLILGVVIIALVLYIVFKNPNRTHYTLPDLKPVNRADITRIVVTRPTGTLTLERSGEAWLIEPNGYPADQGQVDRMLDACSGIALTSLVSESGNYAQYDLTDAKKITLTFVTGSRDSMTLFVGKPASTYRHTFVRLENDDNVYQARDNLRQPFEVEANALRDKVVSHFDAELATAITITDAEDTLEVVKPQAPPPVLDTDSTGTAPPPTPLWRTADGRAVDQTVVKGILSALANLRCNSYIEDSTRDDFTSPVFSISVEGDKPVKLDIYEQREDKNYAAVSSQNDYPFLLAEWSVKRIMKTPGEILAKEAAKQ